MFANLHTRSWFSFQAGGSSPEALVQAAARHGVGALALTDRHGVYGAVRFQRACKQYGIRHIFGAEVPIEGYELVLLASNRDGYSNLCQLLTCAHLRDRLAPSATFDELARHSGDLFCLTGTHEGLLYELVDARRYTDAAAWIDRLVEVFGERLSIEMAHRCERGDAYRIHRLAELGETTRVPIVATGDVRHATQEDYRRYDLLTCIRLGITVFEEHKERPSNDEACLRPACVLRARGIPVQAIARAEEIARSCQVDLIPGHIIPPGARLPAGVTARDLFRQKCRDGFARKYPPGATHRAPAAKRLKKEMEVIEHLDVEEFFLVVGEVVEFARRSGIRCSGRGSAANSIVTYLFDITPVCPIEHKLLFERFLHRGRAGTPDIDLDFDSSRRLEVIAWMEERFKKEHTGMAATINRYLTKAAVQDTAKALGWPAEVAVKLSKGCSYRPPDDPENVAHLRSIVGDTPMLSVLTEAAASLLGCPRHLGQHSGGMVLARTPMHYFTPLQISANGVLVVQFDKDDLEWLGLVKLDVLGLRMMGAITEAVSLVEQHSGKWVDLEELPLDDPAVFEMICEGDVLGLFQIESPAQQSAGARLQARSMQDLIKQVAIVRPGPITGRGLHKYIRRHRGLEPVRFDHPLLEDILADTLGVIIFQEQVLEVCHRFAGLSLQEADRFRRLMSKFRDAGEMEGMRDTFVSAAVNNQGVAPMIANRVFDQVSAFVGYGFCRSHAAAFARTVYQSAYLKKHHAAAFFAGIMQHEPGMYARMTLEQDARRHGICVLVPDINASKERYDLEPHGGTWAVRKPLASVKGVSEALARIIVSERLLDGPFAGVEDFFHRVPLDLESLRALALAGSFDSLEGPNRTALYKIQVLEQQHGAGGRKPGWSFFDLTTLRDEDVPALPGITLTQRLEWDLVTHRGPRVHPMAVLRKALMDYEIRPIEVVRALPSNRRRPEVHVTVAGLVMFRQRPQTARGTMFLFVEDESGHIQCVCSPQIREAFREDLKQPALIIRGRLQVEGPWRGIQVEKVWPLVGVIGGYRGQHGGRTFGREERVLRYDESESAAETVP